MDFWEPQETQRPSNSSRVSSHGSRPTSLQHCEGKEGGSTRRRATCSSLERSETLGSHSSTKWTRPDLTSFRVYHCGDKVAEESRSQTSAATRRVGTELSVTYCVSELCADDVSQVQFKPAKKKRHREFLMQMINLICSCQHNLVLVNSVGE